MQELQADAVARGANRVVRDVLSGDSKGYIDTIGIPGDERVISAGRKE